MYCHLVVRQGLVWLYIFIIIRAEKVNAYYLYIGQIKTFPSVDRSFVCCSESFDRHMEPHNSRIAKIRGARFAPPMGAMSHPTLSRSYTFDRQSKVWLITKYMQPRSDGIVKRALSKYSCW